MAGIIFEGVSKSYGKVEVVKGIDFEVKNKEFMVLVGPSGCGKSTLLRMVAGLEEISSGKLYIGNTLVNDIPPKDRDIAIVFQNYALYPHMTAYQNLAFGLKIRRFDKKEIQE
ncbi:MAG: ATP-binding cassette domain-containing protein, partial [Phaeodactylibacter sp.]|nr:ATP-binding cassette domain-containing protein [Phaeodactylibacter sp.]